jgi:hypothetical protein
MSKKLITAPVVALILISSITALTTTSSGVHAFTCMDQACLVPMCLLSNHTGIDCNAILHDNATLHAYCQEVIGSDCSPQFLKALINMTNANRTITNSNPHLSNTQRYSEGYNDGAQQATTDFQSGKSFNTACDPSGAYTSDGRHTTIFCDGWVKGYTAAWNNLVQHPLPQNFE